MFTQEILETGKLPDTPPASVRTKAMIAKYIEDELGLENVIVHKLLYIHLEIIEVTFDYTELDIRSEKTQCIISKINLMSWFYYETLK